MELLEKFKVKWRDNMHRRLRHLKDADDTMYAMEEVTDAIDELYGCIDINYYDGVADSPYEEGVKAGRDGAIDEIFTRLKKLVEGE